MRWLTETGESSGRITALPPREERSPTPSGTGRSTRCLHTSWKSSTNVATRFVPSPVPNPAWRHRIDIYNPDWCSVFPFANLTFRTQHPFRGKPFLLACRTVTSLVLLRQVAGKQLLSLFHCWSGLPLCRKSTGSSDNLSFICSKPFNPPLALLWVLSACVSFPLFVWQDWRLRSGSLCCDFGADSWAGSADWGRNHQVR